MFLLVFVLWYTTLNQVNIDSIIFIVPFEFTKKALGAFIKLFENQPLQGAFKIIKRRLGFCLKYFYQFEVVLILKKMF